MKGGKKSDVYGIAGFVLGVFSIPLAFFIVFGVLGIIYSNKQREISSNGISTAGLILSLIGTIISLFIWLMIFSLVVMY